MNLNVRIGLYCLLGGLFFTLPAMGMGHFGWYWLSGVMTAAAFVPVARFGPRNLWGQLGAIFAVLEVVGLGCTWSEGVVFFPETKAQLMLALPGATVIYLIGAAALMGLARLLKLTETEAIEVAHRPAALAAPLTVVSAASYVVYYLVFGAIAFQFFTKQFYPHAADQVAAMGSWFWGYQLGRGLLMTLAVLPVIYTLRLPRWQAALTVGMLVWIVGGAAPLLVPSALMTTEQRYIHIVEIMTQNVSLGITAVLLLRPRAAMVKAFMRSAPAA
jgi:hypothetical protein